MNATSDTKVCPHCAETIKAAAKVCPHCRYFQKKWSLHNPTVGLTLYLIICLGALGGLGAFFDSMFGSKEQFAAYRDEISVASSQFSHRVAGSNLLVTVVGTLTNRSSISWKDVTVEAQFSDQAGKLLDVIPSSYSTVVILPHGEAGFKIEGKAAQPEADYASHKVFVRWAKDADSMW